MDDNRMQQADAAYAVGDWRTAAREYLGAAGTGGPGSGVAFHKAGNALMRLRRFDDAATVYARAADDPEYDRRAALDFNLGTAFASAGNNSGAVEVFRRAAENPLYDSSYKALQGLGGALLALGRAEEAADAYRRAALDGSNPDPGKALNCLGLASMSLGRPADAVEAYKAALAHDDYSGRGKAAVNLGFAYACMGRHAEAVRSFERATAEYGHTLNDDALAAYDASKAALEPTSSRVVEGWSTGEMPPVFIDDAPVDDAPEENPFFTRTDDEMREVDKAARRAERAERKSARNVWITVGTWVAIVAVVVGIVSFAWVSGLGYPTQTMTVEGLLEAHRSGETVESYWVAVPTADVEKEMSNLPPQFASFTLGAAEQSAKTSNVDVTVVLEQGAPLTYKISLVREGVGWKVNGVTNDWRSTGGGS
ncbi:MAG: tetratricopeptide repeat protein [Coriobacteriia bacterium]